LIEAFGAHFLPTVYAAALGNLFRRKGRLLLTQSVLIIAGVMFLLLMSLIASLNLTLDNEMARSRYALRLGFTSDQAESKVKALAETINGSQAVEVWQRLPMSLSKNAEVLRQQGSLGAQLLAVPVDGHLYQPLIESGRWLQASDAGQKVLVLSADTAQLNAIQVGDRFISLVSRHQLCRRASLRAIGQRSPNQQTWRFGIVCLAGCTD
jgi:putative ABC transport system permease protein